MKFKLAFERLEQRENPSATDPTGSLPPVEPIAPPPAPIVDPGTNPGQGDTGTPSTDPTNPATRP